MSEPRVVVPRFSTAACPCQPRRGWVTVSTVTEKDRAAEKRGNRTEERAQHFRGLDQSQGELSGCNPAAVTLHDPAATPHSVACSRRPAVPSCFR